mgnify:CR=1 FL=1
MCIRDRYIDIALFDVQLSWLANVASSYMLTGEAPARFGNAHATIVPYQPLATADGRLMLAVGNDGQFAALCRVLGQEAWSADERFATNAARVSYRETLIPLLQAEFKTRPTREWIEALLDAGIPCGPVNDIPTALEDPQARARNMVQSLPHPQGGKMRLVGPAPKMSATPPQIQSAPPALGEHTEEILRELLGYDEARITTLRQSGAIPS